MAAFSASSIPRFTAIFIYYKFDGDPVPIRKWFVIIGHVGTHAICIKPTHQTERYENDPGLLEGCVFYKAGELACFPKDTAIEPDNQFPIPHKDIESEEKAGTLQTHGLPSDFQTKLKDAVQKSETLSNRERTRIQAILN